MDKRWIYIIIILLIGVTALFFIVESSTTLGSAETYVHKFTTTIPPSFNIDESGKEYTVLININTGEIIDIRDLGKGDLIESEMYNKTLLLNENPNVTSIKKVTYDLNGTKLPTIAYNTTKNTINQISYFQKYNHTFVITAKNFQDRDYMDHNLEYILNTLKPDLKQKQD